VEKEAGRGYPPELQPALPLRVTARLSEGSISSTAAHGDTVCVWALRDVGRLAQGAVLSSHRHGEGYKVMDTHSVGDSGMGGRRARVERRTAETDIVLELALDGTGAAHIDTGVGFFNHMLTLLARHGMVDLSVVARGDLDTGAHHTVEDVGICLGQALGEALGDKAGIRRYGDAFVPMDESLAHVALDVSGRPFLAWEVELLPSTVIGGFSTDLTIEFFRAVVANARLTAHVRLLAGANPHHMVEALFKAFARALEQAVDLDPRRPGIPSTKGIL